MPASVVKKRQSLTGREIAVAACWLEIKTTWWKFSELLKFL